jgi:hypothetical protein
MVPDTVPGMPPDMLANATLPVTWFPVWVSRHVISPMPPCPIMVPGDAAVVESDAVPAQVPVSDAAVTGVGAGVLDPPPHATRSTGETTTRQSAM